MLHVEDLRHNPGGDFTNGFPVAARFAAEERLAFTTFTKTGPGADPEAEIGEHHVPETHLIPNMLDAVAGDGPELTVFGDDYPTPDGTCIRDYLHVMDLADAHVRGVEHLMAGGEALTLNLGTGHGFSVREVIDAARAVTNREVPHKIGPRRVGDPPKLVSGSVLAEEAAIIFPFSRYIGPTSLLRWKSEALFLTMNSR